MSIKCLSGDFMGRQRPVVIPTDICCCKGAPHAAAEMKGPCLDLHPLDTSADATPLSFTLRYQKPFAAGISLRNRWLQ
jgi:hypothetical protein